MRRRRSGHADRGDRFSNAYMFRGIFQEDSGVIAQPFVDVGVAVGALSVTVERRHLEQPAFRPERQRHARRSAWYEPTTTAR